MLKFEVGSESVFFNHAHQVCTNIGAWGVEGRPLGLRNMNTSAGEVRRLLALTSNENWYLKSAIRVGVFQDRV